MMKYHNNTYIQDYYDSIARGDVACCSSVIRELENLMDDMDDDKYVFNTYEADRRISFIESHIILTAGERFAGRKMKLLPFQKAIITALYSYYMKEELLDGNPELRFKELLLIIPRKNGKSELIAALVMTEFCIGGDAVEMLIGSCDKDTANMVYESINNMRISMDPKNRDSKRNQQFILNKLNGTKIFKISDKKKTNDGHRCKLCVIDEGHTLLDNEMEQAMQQSFGNSDNPLMITISTEGTIDNGYLDKKIEKGYKVIDGTEEDERFLPFMFIQDNEADIWDVTEEQIREFKKNGTPIPWQESNPALGTVKKVQHIIDSIKNAKTDKATRIAVMTKEFNIKQGENDAWLNNDEITSPDDMKHFTLEDFRGSLAAVGLDIAETTDLTCLSYLFFKEGKRYLYQHYFIPRIKLTASPDSNDGAKYKEWEENGILTVTEGNFLDKEEIISHIMRLASDYKIVPLIIGYDQKFASEIIEHLTKNGATCEKVEQGISGMSNAIKAMEADIITKRLNYDSNPMFIWCIKNVVLKVDYDTSKCMMKKKKNNQRKKIDGAISAAIAYAIYMAHKSEFE